MGFGKVTKEELKELGLDIEGLNGVKAKLDGLDLTKMSKLDKVDAMETTLGELKTGLDGLTQALSKLTPSSTQTVKEGVTTDDSPDFILDPEAATKKVVSDTVNPLLNSVAAMRADLNYNNFKASNPRGFVKLEKEIKEMWDKEPLAVKQNPRLIENIYKLTIANHIDEIASEPKTFFIETGTGSTNNTSGDPKKKPEELLTKDELDTAAKWGLTAQEYLDEKVRTTYV